MSTEKAFTFMTMDILEKILDQAENPLQLTTYLVQQMRELLGAKIVVLLELHQESPETPWQSAAVCPQRTVPSLDFKILFELAAACVSAETIRFHTATEDNNCGKLLRRANWANVALLPLGFGAGRYGILLLLDIFDPEHISSMMATLDPLGRIIGLVLKNATLYRSLEDTIEQRTSQLAASELLFRTLTETAPVGVFQIDNSDRFIYVNGMWCELSGLSALDASGTSWLAAIHPEDRERVASQWQHSRNQGQPLTLELRYLRPDASIVWVLQQASPVYDSLGSVIAYVGTVTNITERIRHEKALYSLNEDLERRVEERTVELRQTNKELQAALEQTQRLQEAIIVKEKLASLTPMVAGVSHELNTPIGNIAVLSSALQERLHELLRTSNGSPDPAELRTFLNYVEKSNEMVIKSASFAGTLVQSFKKVVVDREGAQRRVFRLSELVDDCFNLIRPSFKRHPWLMTNQVPPDVELYSYPGALGQVIDNLVRNSFIHGFENRPSGQVTIGAEILSHDGSRTDRWVRITVSDNGKGIPFSLRHKIFDPFFTTHLGSGGSGLGLSITYNLIQQVLGGTINVNSLSILDGAMASDCGTTFNIEIPLERRD